MHLLIITLALITILTQPSFAEINPLTGEFTLTQIDLQTKEMLYPFKIARNYNHRSKGKGFFGNKWCSLLDETLQREQNTVLISLCEQNTQAVFGKTGTYFVNKDGTEIVKMLEKNKGFIRISQNYVYTYNKNGQLFSIAVKQNYEKPFLKIFHLENGLIEKIVYNSKYHYLFFYDLDKKVITRIRGPNNIDITYSYKENTILSSVTNAWNKKTSYIYDEKDRITSLKLPDEKESHIYYDSEQDMVTRIEDANGCISSASYRVNVQTTTILTQYGNSCKNTDTFTSEKSPIFYKNRKTAQQISKKPAKLNKNLLNTSRGWKKITSGKTRWDYYENEIGNVTQIKETDYTENKTRFLSVDYSNQKIVQIKLAGISAVSIKYFKTKPVGLAAEKIDKTTSSYKALAVFSRFLLAKAEVEK